VVPFQSFRNLVSEEPARSREVRHLVDAFKDPRRTWEVDLQKVIDVYVEREFGGANIDFIEAATLVQMLSVFYARRVESLCTLTFNAASSIDAEKSLVPGFSFVTVGHSARYNWLWID
jgi:hypothetical protein